MTVGNGKSLLSQKKITVQDQGTLKIEAGGIVNAANILVEGGVLGGQGTVAVTSEILIGTGGTLSPGLAGVGDLSIDGSYTQESDGVFAIDIDGDNTGGNHDTLGVTVDIDLGGTITIDTTFLAETDISAGDMFEIISTTEGTLSGKFDKVLLTPRDDVYFDVTYEESTANVTARNFGDGNQDGYVDGIDAQIFATVLLNNNALPFDCGENCFAGANFLNAFDLEDSNGLLDTTQVVDFFDIPKFAQAMIDHPSPSSSSMSLSQAYDTINSAILSASVPEPNTAVLVILGGLFGLRFRRPR